MKWLQPMTMCSALCLVAACSPTVTHPCDLLVPLKPAPETARFIVENDRPFAEGVARHRGRVAKYGCEGNP